MNTDAKRDELRLADLRAADGQQVVIERVMFSHRDTSYRVRGTLHLSEERSEACIQTPGTRRVRRVAIDDIVKLTYGDITRTQYDWLGMA